MTKFTKTHNNFIQSNETILISDELVNRISSDKVKSNILGFDDKQGALTLVLHEKPYQIKEIDFNIRQIIIDADVYLLHALLNCDRTASSTLMIKGKALYNYKVNLTHIKSTSNTNFNYTFDIIKKEDLNNDNKA